MLEVATNVRKIWPKKKILGARVTADDCIKNGISLKESKYLIKKLEEIGFDYVTPTSGGIIPITNKKVKSCYQVKYCRNIKKNIKILVCASGMIRTKKEINEILKKKYADFISVSKPFINNPYWLYKIAKQDGINLKIPNQYLGCFAN